MQENTIRIENNFDNLDQSGFACFDNPLSKDDCKAVFSGGTYKQAKIVKNDLKLRISWYK